MDLTTNQDELLLVLPLIALLLLGYFRVDEIFGPRKNGHPAPPPSQPVVDPADISLMTHPDGRPWN
jgi:hypothetical protein